MQSPQTVVVTYIAATPEQVWSALTEPAQSEQYFFGRRVESDWQVGSPFVLRMDDGRVDSQGVVLLAEPPYRLSVTWRVEWLEAFRELPEVVVTWQVDALGQALRLAVPSLSNSLISLIKDTSLVSVITVTELLRTAQEIIAATYQPLPLYLAVAVIYWILSTGLSVLQRVLERRLSLPGRH